MTLADALAPLSVPELLRDYLGRQYVRVPGPPGRFRELASWQELSQLLTWLRAHDGRVSLVKQGQGVPQSSYLHTSPTGRSPYLIGPAVRMHVLNGATLVVNQVDELLPGVRSLVESCESTFNVHVAANLYAGWRSDNGFDVHWDRHDTLIVQIIGRKNWTIWAPTKAHPLIEDPLRDVPRPSDPPVWEGTLEAGDTLYMPRGWWHVACPRDEPCLHVTLGLKHPTGIEFLNWMVGTLRAVSEVRQDVPQWLSASQQDVWLQSLRDACVTALRPESLERYLSNIAEMAFPRPVVKLPESSHETTLADLNDQTLLRLVRHRRLTLRGDGPGILCFEANGRLWRCNALLGPALSLLDAVTPCTLGDMHGSVEPRGRPLVRAFTMGLLRDGVVWGEPASMPAHTTTGQSSRGH